MKKKKFDFRKLCSDILMGCGVVTAVCTACAQIYSTFFAETRVSKNESATVATVPIITQTIQNAPPGTHITKTVEVTAGDTPADQPRLEIPTEPTNAGTSAPEAPTASYVWIIILVSALGAAIAGWFLRKKIADEVEKV